MRKQNILFFVAVLFFFLSSGCSSELRKIEKQRGLTTECYESLKLLKGSLERSPDGLTLQIKPKFLASAETRSYTIQMMQCSFFSNVVIGECWSKNFTQTDIQKLFGKPTREVMGRDLSYEYVILNKSCSTKNGEIIKEYDCGLLRFTFGKDGVVNNGMMYLNE